MKPFSQFLTLLNRRYWLLLTVTAVLAFCVSWLARQSSEMRGTRVFNERVHAAGPLPSFELKRTERLRSETIHDKVTIVTTVARRADGAEVEVVEIRERLPTVERKLFFPRTGVRIHLNDTVRAKSTFHVPPNDPILPRLQLMKLDPSTRCTVSLSGTKVHSGPVSEESILGIPVVKLTTEGVNTQTQWFAPQLGCVEIMTRWDWRQNGGGLIASSAVSTPDYVLLQEPAESLFAVPSDYQELKPSERMDRVSEWRSKHFPAGSASDRNESARQSGDELYAKYRSPVRR